MVSPATLPLLKSRGQILPQDPESFGWLRDSNDALNDPEELRRRMEEDGYLYLPGYLDRADVQAARKAICEILSQEGLLDLDFPVESAIAKSGPPIYFRSDIGNDSSAADPLHRVIYGPQIMDFYDRFLGGEATHYDFTWLRVVSPGGGTQPHCDVVYMGRGTHQLYTAWVPLGDVPLEVGGLIVLEGSHRDAGLRQGYCTMDVDTACENQPANQLNAAGFPDFGALASDPVSVQRQIGGRWLTAREFRMGDLLTFSVFTVHASLDNSSNQIRLSSDSRYQLASEPLDERWIGENPPAHGGKMIRNVIC
jgi:Phytanoyl-CoA dioxygenase (PhyH)